MANPKFFNPSDLLVASTVTLEVTAGDIVTTYIGYIHPEIRTTTEVAIRRIVRDGTDPNAITSTEYWSNGEMFANVDFANAQTTTYLPLKNLSYVK